MATQAPALHIGVAESVQSADVEHVDTTAAMASMVLPVKETVQDITAGSTAGAVDTHVPQYFPLETGSARFMLISCHAQKAGTTHRWCNPLPSRVKNRSRHHKCQAEAHPWATLPNYHGPP